VTWSPVGWIVTNWRLKLLALVLTVGLLGAVAFAENPPTFDNVPVRILYENLPPDLVVMNPRLSVDIEVAGLRDAVQRYRASAAGVSVDLSRARAGANQVFTATPKVDVPGVTPSQGSIPLRLTIERLATRQLDIEVRAPKTSPGVALIPEKTYATCGNSNDRCQVTVSGAASVVSQLKAYVNYDVSITAANRQTSPNEPVQFELNGRHLDLGRDLGTLPAPNWTPEVVTVQVATQGGSLTRTVAITVKPQGSQACGYTITGIDVQPSLFATITGPIDTVSKLSSVSLDAPVVLSGLTATSQFTRSIVTGSPQVTADPPMVRVVVNVAPAFACAAPGPAAGGSAPTPPPASPLAPAVPSPSP
jgi:YbbR domain-containing protein